MRILLISDIHFGKNAVNEEFNFTGESMELAETQHAKPLIAGIVEILKDSRPDYMFIAGDLTSSGNPLEFKYCHAKITEIAKSLNVSPEKVIFCLGNHDLDWRISDIKSQYPNSYRAEDIEFISDFYQYLSGNIANEIGLPNALPPTGCDKFVTPFTFVEEFDDCIVFVLNSSHKSERNQKYKHGYLSTKQLSWFSNTAQKCKKSSKKKIVLLHHHPFNYPFPLPGLDISTLEEGAEIVKVCGENGIDLVIHGHRHQPQAKTVYDNSWMKPITFVCSGSVGVNANGRPQGIPNTFHLIDFKEPSYIVLNNYSYSAINGWAPTVYNVTTPVDGEMMLGKMISTEEAKSIIHELPINTDISYSAISSELHYLPVNKLMELIKEVHSESIVYGLFPDNIIIFNKG